MVFDVVSLGRKLPVFINGSFGRFYEVVGRVGLGGWKGLRADHSLPKAQKS